MDEKINIGNCDVDYQTFRRYLIHSFLPEDDLEVWDYMRSCYHDQIRISAGDKWGEEEEIDLNRVMESIYSCPECRKFPIIKQNYCNDCQREISKTDIKRAISKFYKESPSERTCRPLPLEHECMAPGYVWGP